MATPLLFPLLNAPMKPTAWSRKSWPVWAAAVVLLAVPGSVMAQRVVPADTIEQRDSDDDRDVIDQTGTDDEDDAEDDDSPFQSFDDVQVERVQPDEIPDFRPGLPDGASSSVRASDLPRTLTGDQLQRVSAHVAASTVEILALSRPPSTYRQTPMVFRGHALWISPSGTGEDPVLISTADWLDDADEIYAIDGDVSQALSRGGLELGGHKPQPLDDVMADRQALIERHRHDLVALDVEKSNRHVNLARLTTEGDEALDAPAKGLVLHDMDSIMPGSIFGYSPAVSSDVTPTGYENSDELEREYSFYFLVSFQAILGAPIVTTEGKLLAITALRYPEDTAKSLAIPPGAIHAFLGTDRADPDGDDDGS